MTPEAQRVAIGEACGWTLKPLSGLSKDSPLRGTYAPNQLCWEACRADGKWALSALPDYLTDLNAMHEAEKVLTVLQKDQLPYHLLLVLRGQHHIPSQDIYSLCDFKDLGRKASELVSATAAQHCGAFLRAIGKWEDSPK